MTTAGHGARDPRVVIVGSGLGGTGLAVHLKKAGINNLLILEQGDDVGGVWRDNTYPGAACDVPSTLYSYSFEKRTKWSQRYSGQAEIQQYVRNVAEKYGVLRHVRFNTTVVSATFSDDTGKWLIGTDTGEEITADVFVPATGQLSRPSLPAIPGRDRFTGESWHSARWNHDFPLDGKRVAVIGTGASALQFVPQLQPKVGRLKVFQRSPHHIMPYHNFSYDEKRHRYKRARPLQLFDRFTFWYAMEFGQQILTKWRPLGPLISYMTRRHLHKQVPDPRLRERLTPKDKVGCKRVLFSSKFLPALTKPNAELVSEGIEEITPTGIRTVDGVHHEVDAIVYGTGFKTFDLLGHIQITGQDRQLLSDRWKEGAHAYLGMSVPNFPNMFIVYGPNTDLGSGSVLYMLESQFPYITQAVQAIKNLPDGRHISVRHDVWEEFDRDVQDQLNKSVWVSGCTNWYRNEYGRVVTNWPQRSWRFRRRARKFVIDRYDVATAPVAR